MKRLVATKSADTRFHNINLLGFASYVGALRSLLASSEQSATIITPFMDKWGLKLLSEAWEQCQDKDPIWSIFVREADESITNEAEENGWNLYSYRPDPDKRGEYGFHAKLVTVDESCAVIGSMNLIRQNLYSNLELGVEFEETEMLWRIGRLVKAFRRVGAKVV